ncbi:MAG: hypothetical protein V4469_04545 [Patescibacteria group bacterium]
MKISLFGKNLFEFNKADRFIGLAQNEIKESKFLQDFFQSNGSEVNWNTFNNAVSLASWSPSTTTTVLEAPKPPKKEPTPKEVYQLKTLNDDGFKLNTDAKYVDGQIEDFKDKLALVKSEEYDMRNGVKEISSILIRMENRKKYANHKKFFEEYPYTTTAKINVVIKDNDHLKVGQIAQFVADLPKDAVIAMKKYNAETKKLCDKQAVFYIIANKKDFVKSDKRRDPILLAQSPFGHFWQILGAWDEEMILLEEL